MRFRKREREDGELDVTTFMNLMVVLIPFLLLNAVFAQVSVLKLNLPADGATPAEQIEAPPLVLEVMIYPDGYVISDRLTGPLKSLPNNDKGEHDSAGLHAFLVDIKGRFPRLTDITLLCDESTSYELLVQTMDAARLRTTVINGQPIRQELFPEIGLGRAPSARPHAEGEFL